MKWGRSQTPEKAFARLRHHIDSVHWEQADAIVEAGEAHETDVNERIGTYS